MQIHEVRERKKRYQNLLLLADEQEELIDQYLDRGTMYVLEDDDVYAECVVTDEGDGVLELQNLAVTPGCHRRGYGTQLIRFLEKKYACRYRLLRVGTGDSPATIPFYRACGFHPYERVANYFLEHYDHPIWEDGIQLRDRILLHKALVRLRPLQEEEITRALFASFYRRQEVTACWRREGEKWVVRDDPFLDDWTEEEYAKLVELLRRTVRRGGLVCGAFCGGVLKGFVSVESGLFGGANRYLDMTSLHVSEDMRRMGIGRSLLAAAGVWAREQGAEKLYISAHSAAETQAFYRGLGCRDACLPQQKHVEQEPFDCQLELVLCPLS